MRLHRPGWRTIEEALVSAAVGDLVRGVGAYGTASLAGGPAAAALHRESCARWRATCVVEGGPEPVIADNGCEPMAPER